MNTHTPLATVTITFEPIAGMRKVRTGEVVPAAIGPVLDSTLPFALLGDAVYVELTRFLLIAHPELNTPPYRTSTFVEQNKALIESLIHPNSTKGRYFVPISSLADVIDGTKTGRTEIRSRTGGTSTRKPEDPARMAAAVRATQGAADMWKSLLAAEVTAQEPEPAPQVPAPTTEQTSGRGYDKIQALVREELKPIEAKLDAIMNHFGVRL